MSHLIQRADINADEIKAVQDILEGANLKVVGGVEYRIERSRYYISQFRIRNGLLKIVPLGEFVAYGDYVERRLGRTFAYVDALNHRYARVRAEIRTLYQRAQAATILNQNSKIAEIQEIADFALVAVLAPYYIGSVASHILTGVLWEESNHNGPSEFWAVICFVALLFAVMRSHIGLEIANSAKHAAKLEQDPVPQRQDLVERVRKYFRRDTKARIRKSSNFRKLLLVFLFSASGYFGYGFISKTYDYFTNARLEHLSAQPGAEKARAGQPTEVTRKRQEQRDWRKVPDKGGPKTGPEVDRTRIDAQQKI